MQLVLEQVLSQVIAFLIMLWVLKRFAWKPIVNMMEERRKKIQSEFDTIEKHKHEAKKLVETYNEKLRKVEAEARVKVSEELNRAHKMAQKIHQEAHEHAKGIISKAQDEVNYEIAEAKKQLKDEMVNLVIATTEKIVQEKLEEDGKQKAFIEKILEENKIK